MRILPVTISDPDPEVIKEAVTCLRDGGIMIYPTDTSYGIGCIGGNYDLFKKIFAMKQRDETSSLSMIFQLVADIAHYAYVDKQTEKILKRYLPGPYSFLLNNTDRKLKPSNEVMARIPDFPLTKLIAHELGYPYTSTSANLSGESPAYTIEELDNGLLNPDTLTIAPDLLLDAGTLPANPPSTIVDLMHWPPTIIRQGSGQFDLKEAQDL